MALLGNETFTRQPHLGTRNANEATVRPAQKDSLGYMSSSNGSGWLQMPVLLALEF